MNTQMQNYLHSTGLMTKNQISSLMNKHQRKELSSKDIKKEINLSQSVYSKRTMHRRIDNSKSEIEKDSHLAALEGEQSALRHESFLTEQQTRLGYDMLQGLEEPSKREKYSRHELLTLMQKYDKIRE